MKTIFFHRKKSRATQRAYLIIAGLAMGITSAEGGTITHTIDWYISHPRALDNAVQSCNIENGTIATQDCRNAAVAQYQVLHSPIAAASATAAGQPKN